MINDGVSVANDIINENKCSGKLIFKKIGTILLLRSVENANLEAVYGVPTIPNALTAFHPVKFKFCVITKSIRNAYQRRCIQ